MTRPEYKEIRTLDALDEAIKTIGRENRDLAEELRFQASCLPELYSPRALVSEGIRRAAHSVSFFGFALKVTSFVRNLLKKK